MGRKVQISREVILDKAVQLLLREGYGAITVQALATEVGCSTQPIVWHFENMRGFRKAFLDHCIGFAKARFMVCDGSLDEILSETACRYIGIAAQMPHLFRFVFVDNKEECKNHEIIQSLQLENTKRIVTLLESEKGLSQAQAAAFLMDFEFYIHGIASYTASGFCSYSAHQIKSLAGRAKDAFLTCAGQN